jgi:toxin-antitoxin system PIN domain toxin
VFVVDTNVLVYAADTDSTFHETCLDRLNTWREQASAWFVTWGICYEFLRVTTHPRVLRNPWSADHAWHFLEGILQAPGLDILIPTDRHEAVAGAVLRELPHLSGNLMYDAQTAALMREHGITTIYTRDTDFHRFPFLRTVDPVA